MLVKAYKEIAVTLSSHAATGAVQFPDTSLLWLLEVYAPASIHHYRAHLLLDMGMFSLSCSLNPECLKVC